MIREEYGSFYEIGKVYTKFTTPSDSLGTPRNSSGLVLLNFHKIHGFRVVFCVISCLVLDSRGTPRNSSELLGFDFDICSCTVSVCLWHVLSQDNEHETPERPVGHELARTWSDRCTISPPTTPITPLISTLVPKNCVMRNCRSLDVRSMDAPGTRRATKQLEKTNPCQDVCLSKCNKA